MTSSKQHGRRSALAIAAMLFAGASAALGVGEPPGCDADHRELCLYTPAASYATAAVETILTDPARNGHIVPIRILYPLGASGPRPVIVWNHGGGVKAPRQSGGYNFGSVEHARLFTAAGYVTVLVDRTAARGVPTAAQLGVCRANGAGSPSACQGWYGHHVLGPTNTPFVVSSLSHLLPSQLPGFSGSLDLARVVVGGFSGGTELVLNHAGASQSWPGLQQASVAVPGAVAFITAAPRGPAYAGFSSGFVETSFRTIGAAPFLFLLARNENPKEPSAHGGAARSPAWLDASPGDKLLSWDTNDSVTHVNLDLASCGESPLQAAHCAWNASLTLAFLDSYVAHRQEATDWLGSAAFRILTAGAIEAHWR
jgi:hypothetical protein